ncbi:MAG: DUF3667 domain-containing protein [Chthoniobacterales bacterium]
MSEETPLILGDALAAELNRPPRRRWLRGKKQPPPPLTHCENCGTALRGPYCAQCGQPAIDYRRSLGSLLTDAADAFFNFDARFFQSFGLLLIKPWRLTNEFIEGKRARHVHPLRVYLVASVTFFLVINFLSRSSHLHTNEPLQMTVPPAAAAVPLAAAANRPDATLPPFFSIGLDAPSASPADPSLAGPLAEKATAKPSPSPARVIFEELDKQTDIPPAYRWLEARAKEKIGPTGDRGDLFLKALIQNIAPMVLCCIPLFAIVLKILYIFKRRFYIDHLIFALHTHAFIFLSTVTIIGIGFLLALKSKPLTAVVCTLLSVAVFVQLLIAIRRVYQQNWLATVFKFVLGSFIYSILLGVAFSVTAFVTLLLP